MIRILNMVAVCVVALLVSAVVAQDEKPKKKKPAQRQAGGQAFALKGIELTDEQKEKVNAIRKELAPKARELNQKLRGIMTPERRKAAAEARKGKKGKEAQEAVKAALNLSEEEQKIYEETTKARQELRKEFLSQVKPLLTEEQKAKLPGGKKKGKKKDS